MTSQMPSRSGPGYVLTLFLLAGLPLILATCGSQRKPPVMTVPVPLPEPVVLKQTMIQNWLADNELDVEIRNDGPAGLVHIEAYTRYDAGGTFTRGETGMSKAFRETFTEQFEPAAQYHPNYVRPKQGGADVLFQADEIKTVKLILPGYNWATSMTEGGLFVDVSGIPSPGPAAKPTASR